MAAALLATEGAGMVFSLGAAAALVPFLGYLLIGRAVRQEGTGHLD